jgi:hypothetical protein
MMMFNMKQQRPSQETLLGLNEAKYYTAESHVGDSACIPFSKKAILNKPPQRQQSPLQETLLEFVFKEGYT